MEAEADGVFQEFISIVRGEEKPGLSMTVGSVIATSPLTIRLYGLNLSRNALKLNDIFKIRPLQTGDKVLALSEDMQLFYIICKVVSP